MVQILLKYDFGSDFVEPIKLYTCCTTVTNPTDLGTICKYFLDSVYRRKYEPCRVLLIKSSSLYHTRCENSVAKSLFYY